MDQEILLRNGYLEIPAAPPRESYEPRVSVATVVSNLATYGYTVDRATLDALMAHEHLDAYWKRIEPILKRVTGKDRNMGDFMVYKNFPKEVMAMDQATQVFHQMLIYHGVPYEALVEAEEARPVLGEMKRLKVLTLATEATAGKIFADLQAMGNRWNDDQTVWADKLIGNRNVLLFSDFKFKENAVNLAVKNWDKVEVEVTAATDVMRVAAGLSSADISLREKVRFRRFKRPERQRLLTMLESQKNLVEDFAARPGPWKRLLEHLRPGDYKNTYPRVVAAYDDLYNGTTKSFAAQVDPPFPTQETLDAVATRPGEFLRRFHYLYSFFGRGAVEKFLPVMEKLSTRQLAGLRAYLRTINERVFMIYPPKSNWAKAQVVPNDKTKLSPNDRQTLDARISQILSKRLGEAFPEGVALDLRVDQIKLQTNDQKLAEYGRGTSFDIPEGVTFVRSASYWANSTAHGTTWYDNGWNFFDDNWQPMGTCAWNEQYFPRESHDGNHWGVYKRRKEPAKVERCAIYSGDPVNTKDLKGRACQMADLYLDALRRRGVRYCVWNVLCYSRIKFSDAEDVLATLQWGENAEEGNTYEPSRAQMVFPLKSPTFASYVAYLDLKLNKLVYMDVGFKADVSNAAGNSERLSQVMPAYVEYLDALPTVLEVLQDAPQGTMPVLYEDSNMKIDGGRAFVFRPARADNSYDRVTVTDLTNL